jgi:hypothetical protein
MKVAFVHIPKTGGGSIHQWLIDNHKNNFTFYTGHKLLDEVYKTNGKCDFSFSCTRNTYSRMVSLYVFTGIKTQQNIKKSYRRNSDPTEYLQIQEVHKKGIVPFLHFIKLVKPMLMESQLVWIKGVDLVLRLENLNQDFKNVQDKLGVHIPLTKKLRKLDYVAKDYYSLEFKRTVEQYFGDEIEHFKYLPKY